MRVCELQKRQWATPADLGISSQIVICLLFACDYLRYIVLQVCRTQRVENAHQHPLIYMKGVTSSDLKAVVNYVYYGEANVAQANLNSFLALAEDLELKGLVRRDESDSQQQQPTKQVNQRPASSQAVSPLIVNNDNGGDRAGAATAMRLRREQLDSFKMEEEDYGPLGSGVGEQYGGGIEDDYLEDQDNSQNQEQGSQII